MRHVTLASFAFMALSLVPAAFGAPVPAPAGASTAPNDRYFSEQWALSNTGGTTQIVPIDADKDHTVLQKGTPGADIGWLAARGELAQKGTNPVTVAVIDSGVDPTHEDLQGRLAPGAFDFLLNLPAVTDPAGHGTHVAGIIAANDDNGIGIAGIAPASVKILPLRVLWAANDPAGSNFYYPNPLQPGSTELISDFVSQAVDYAVQKKVSIITLSIVWPELVDTQKARASIANAVKAGVLVVAAAGNDRKEQPTFPCSYEGVICVGSVTNTGDLAIYSNYGGRVDLLAPGDSILSTYPKTLLPQVSGIAGYEYMSGTSMSAPIVAGVAAAVLSAHPGISASELKARLMVSARAIPSDDAALYGMVNLKGALDASPQPVYLPDFKSIDEIPVDESSLSASGRISIQNLWAAANGVTAAVMINGKFAGSATAKTLASGASITVPWNYRFASLDDSSDLRFTVQVSDASGTSKSFSLTATAARSAQLMPGNQTYAVPGIKPADWISVNNQHLFPNNLYSVETYPSAPGLPVYFQQVAYGTAGSVVNLYDPSNQASPMTRLELPGIKQTHEILRIDALGNGKMDWVAIGVGAPSNLPVNAATYYEFYFMDPSFKPLFGTQAASEFQISASQNRQTGDWYIPGSVKVSRSFAAHGSWLRTTYNGGSFVVPAFIDAGVLPPKDAFATLDPNGQTPGVQHLYYLSPIPSASGSPVQLESRALDGATFRTQYPNATLLNLVPDPQDDQAARLKILMMNGNLLSTPIQMWDVESPTNANLVPTQGWDALTSSALPFAVQTAGDAKSSSAFLSYFGESNRGNVTWVGSNGALVDRTEFQFSSPENPLIGSIGVDDMGSLGHFWFLQSGFDIVGYRDGGAGSSSANERKTLPIDRETSFYTDQFSEIFTPEIVGTAAAPQPALYIDATIVHGNVVSVAAWDPVSDQFTKPLRYSMIVPDGCLEMNPVQLNSSGGSFAVPFLCGQNGNTQLQLVIAQP